MDFEFSEEQRALADSVTRFLDQRYDFEQRKAIVRSEAGASDAVWRQLAELGVLALAFSEAAGGLGGGAVDLMGTMQAIGAALVVEPVLATVLAGRLIDRSADADTRARLLGPVIAGHSRLAFAYGEDGARYQRNVVTTRAVRADEGWVIDGLKRVVIGATGADQLVVSAATAAGGLSLFTVPTQAAGVAMTAYRQFDNQRAADVALTGVRVGADALLGAEGQALPAIDEALDFATALLCAEAVGAMQDANDSTLEYLKTRKQFGVPIGSFQALQHRMAEMVISMEQARSMSYLACSRVDGEADAVERARCVSAAKIKVADAARQVAQETVQLHGGIGMTDELKASHTFRRLTLIAQQYGDADFHLARFAALGRRV